MKKSFLLMAMLLLLVSKNFAQEDSTKAKTEELKSKIEEIKGAFDGLNESYLETKTTVDALKKIKISGYIQAQFQSADVDGAASFAGGNFAAGVHNRSLIRRGRLKVMYDNDLTQYVLQIDATEKGLGLKDAFIYVKEPWLKTFALKAGVFDRPFGFEISYSSSSRESPERSRLFQSLFPGERDLGASLEIFPSGDLSFLNFKGGFFAGNGINPETDNNKDFIGHLGFNFPFTDANFEIDGGISTYIGTVTLASGKSVYTVDNAVAPKVDATNKDVDRTYFGADLQLYYDLPVLGGLTLRGEYISGKQPGTATSNGSFTGVPSGDIYLRNFAGYYLMYVQNIGDRNQLVVKYDSYDPNTDVSADQIGQVAGAKLGAGDIQYSTLGLGLVHYWDDNVKFTFYYDSVTNETSKNLAGFGSDLKDNVFTFRVQYKF